VLLLSAGVSAASILGSTALVYFYYFRNMKINTNEIYHVYNQGNNRERVFYSDENYLKFIYLYRKLVWPHCDTLAYCLMPNHFHFLIHCNEKSVVPKEAGNNKLTNFTNGLRLLQSSYTQYLNPLQQRSGSLFRQRVKIKSTSAGENNYHTVAFQYIHQNPFVAGLVKKMEDWPFSSYQDYAGLRTGTLCNKLLAGKLLNFDSRAFEGLSFTAQDESLLPNIW
jgi:putative transposase